MSEPQKEKWLSWAALTTTILAVCTSIATLRSGKNSTLLQILTTQESNRWAYYQSKSIKQHTCESTRDVLTSIQTAFSNDAATSRALSAKISTYAADIKRYDKEKKEIQKEAESLAAPQADAKKHSSNFGIAIILLQLGIMLASMAALLKKPLLWQVGLIFGVIGLCFFANGFFLFF